MDGQDVRRLPAGAPGCGTPPLHALHERHNREAEGRGPYNRWLHDADVHHGEVGVRPQRRGYILVYGGHRMGYGSQLHRLWSFTERRDNADVRGSAELPRARSILVDHRSISRQHLLYGTYGYTRFHQMGRCLA